MKTEPSAAADPTPPLLDTKNRDHIDLFIESMRLLCKMYHHLSEDGRKMSRSRIIPHVFSSKSDTTGQRHPHLIIQILAIKFLTKIFIEHRSDSDISDLLGQYVKFVEENVSQGNLSVITALVDIIPEIIQYYLQDLISLLVRLAGQQPSGSKSSALVKFREKSIKKCVKNVMCAVLKANNFDEKISFGIMDCVTKQLNVSKSDSNQLIQILSTRGLNYQNSAPQLQLSNEQISTAIVAALQHYGNTQHPNQPAFILPPNANLSIHVIAEIVMTAMRMYNPTGAQDEGLQHWAQIIANIQHFTQQALQIQIQHLSQVASVMDTSHAGAATNKFISQTQPFSLAPVELEDVGEYIRIVLQSLLDVISAISEEQKADIDPVKITEIDGAQMLLDFEKSRRKRKADTMEDDSLSGSTDALATDRVRETRAYKTALTSRIFAHSIFSEYKGLLIDWKLADFTHRWDLCLRWLWESSYLDHVNKLANNPTAKPAGEKKVKMGTVSEDSENSDSKSLSNYESNLLLIVEEMFLRAESAVIGQSTTFMPWLTSNSQSHIFRKFMSQLPYVPVNGRVFEIIKSFMDIELTLPLPTPLEKVKYQLSLEILYDLVTAKPALRKRLLPILLSNLFSRNSAKRQESIKIIRGWWTVDTEKTGEFGYADGVFKPVYPLLEGVAILLVGSLTQKNLEIEHFRKMKSKKAAELIVETLSHRVVTENGDDMESDDWEASDVHGILEFYFSLIPRKPEIFRVFLEVIPKLTGDVVVETSAQSISNFLLGIGLPKDENDMSYKLLQQVIQHVHDSKQVQNVLLHTVKTMTNYPPDITLMQPFTTPSKSFTRMIIDMMTSKRGHELSSEFWACIIAGDGFTRAETYQAIYALTESFINEENPQNHDMFVYIVKEVLKPPSVLSPVEFLIFINNLCDLDPIVKTERKFPPISVQKCTQALDLFFYNAHSPFTMRSISAAISLMVSNYTSGSAYPLLFMRTVLGYLVRFKEASFGFVLSQVLAPCCNLRMLWNAAKDRVSSKSEESRAAKMLWDSFILCLRECAPNSFVLIIQLQRDRLSLVVDKLGDEFMKRFWDWCMQERAGIRGKKVQVALEVMDRRIRH